VQIDAVYSAIYRLINKFSHGCCSAGLQVCAHRISGRLDRIYALLNRDQRRGGEQLDEQAVAYQM